MNRTTFLIKYYKFMWKALLVLLVILGVLSIIMLLEARSNSIRTSILLILTGALAIVELKTKLLYNLMKKIIYKIAYSKPFLDTFYPEGYKK